MWAPVPILLAVIAALLVALLFATYKYRLEVQTLSWRLDTIWRKVQQWHSKVDRVTGEMHRMTGEQMEIEIGEGAEEFDDVDRAADTQPRSQSPKRKRRKAKRK